MPATLNTLSFFVNRTRQIYSLPSVALEVLELTNHPRVDCHKLKECIERDPALVGKILRVVNSSLFGLGSDVSNLNQAVALLGIKSLKLLVLGFSLSETMFTGKTSDALQHAWRHTLTSAAAARDLCETVWHVSGDEAFIAALLARLGKFVLLDELGEPYANLLTVAVADRENLAHLEQAALGFDHTELSAELLSHWRLPESLTRAVRMSTRPDQLAMLERPDIFTPAAVRMAGLIADLLVDDRHDCLQELLRDPLACDRQETDLDELRLSDELLSQLVDRMEHRIAALANALSFELPTGKDHRDVLVAAHERLSQLAADAACVTARQWPLVEKRGAEVAGVSTAVAHYVNRFADAVIRVRPSAADVPQKGTLAHSPTNDRIRYSAPQATTNSFDARLVGRLAIVVGICRQARCALSLVLLELDKPRNREPALDPLATTDFARQLHAAATAVDHPGAVCVPLGDARFALVIAGCDRRAAVSIGHQLHCAIRSLVGAEQTSDDSPTLSVGVATVSLPSKNFPPDDLLKAAARCLDAAQLSGGNTLKSIDVY